MDARLLLDLLLSALLVATMVYAWMLNRRLDQLRGDRDDMAKVITAFNDATQRAEASVPRLKRAAEEAGQQVQERVEKAQLLRDDLAFMIERGDALANRLEEGVRQARAEQRPSAAAMAMGRGRAPRATPTPVPEDTEATGVFVANQIEEIEAERSEAERELLRAMQSAR